ncbi:MAG: hypothetical protein QM767_22175 [Anaeromyxobacter sp.]
MDSSDVPSARRVNRRLPSASYSYVVAFPRPSVTRHSWPLRVVSVVTVTPSGVVTIVLRFAVS